jgi:hypothetical protein
MPISREQPTVPRVIQLPEDTDDLSQEHVQVVREVDLRRGWQAFTAGQGALT